MPTKIVKIKRPIVSDTGDWLAYDEKREHEEWFTPTPWLKEVMGARMQAYFVGQWSGEGWQFKRRLKEHRYYW